MALIIDRNKCLACGLCAERCVLDNIRVQTSPCRAACPVDLNPQRFTALVALGRFTEAAEAIHQSFPFPRLLAHLCPAPCQGSCTRKRVDNTMAIQALERFLVGNYEPRPDRLIPGVDSGERVAVVGAGPAGMTAAVMLRQAGHKVILFEAGKGVGGSLRRSVPQELLAADAALLDQLGVDQRLGVTLGRQTSLAELRRDFLAILLTVGAKANLAFAVDEGAKLGRDGRLWVDPETMSTSLEGLFVAGEMLPGVTHPVTAMGSAQRVVGFVDRFVRGQSLQLPQALRANKNLPAKLDAHRIGVLREQVASGAVAHNVSLSEVGVLDQQSAQQAAGFCLRCAQPVDYYDECWYCLPCEVECPTNALVLEIPFLVR